MSEWKNKSLAQFVTFQRGFDLPKSQFISGDIPVFGSTSILGYHNLSKVVAPGVITGRSGTLGKFQYSTVAFWPHNTTLWVKDFKGNDPKFSYYLMQCFDFSDFNGGGAVPTLNRNVLKSLKVDVPPLQTQQKIAKILSNYDDLIENNLKRIKLLEESARLTYEEWFLRFRIDGKKLDIDTATGLPFEWEVRKISDFVDTASGGTPSRRKPEEFYKDGTIPWVKTKELKNFMIIDADEHITEQGLKKSSAKMFPANTVLLAMYGNTIGEVTFSTFPTSTNQACCAFLVKDKAYLSYFIHQYLLKNKQKILGYRMGAAQENISQQIIKSIEIEIPSESLLQLFGKRLSEKYNLIKSLHTQNQLLKEARDILLPRLMTGMIDTDNMDIAV